MEPVIVMFACFKAGLIAVPLNTYFKAPEIAWIMRHAEPSLCFASPGLEGITNAALASNGLDVSLPNNLLEPSRFAPETLPPVGEDEVCALLYTSGTTARPKGVMHTHRSVLSGAQMIVSMAEAAAAGAVMLMTQLAHASGLICSLIPSVLERGPLVLLPFFNPAAALDAIQRFGVAFTGGMPVMLSMLAEEQTRQPREVGSLKHVVSGGDTLPQAVQERFAQLFRVPVLELLAMTESCPVLWNTADDMRPGSVGKVRSTVAVQVVAPDENGIGELAVQSPATFSGYWKDEAATNAVLRDGWLYTGDLVRVDNDGYVWFAGRLKHIIVRGGSNIAPQQIEEVLMQHPLIAQAGVIGTPDPVYGQRVEAFVVVHAGGSVTEEELQTHSRTSLADYKVPERIRFVRELPRTFTGKLDRRALGELGSSESNAPLQRDESRV
jgi:long-chain acyl-CoA synthetase